MAQATCPSCRTEQTLPRGATGYRCVGCGRAWSFSVCAECGGRFHARPGVGAWTCPRCGARNAGAGRVPVAVQPDPAGAAAGVMKPRWPGFMLRRPASYTTAGHPLVPVAGGAAAAVVVFIFLRLFVFGGEPVKSATEIARAQTCLHLREFQVTRVGALRRGAELLVGDAAAFRAADDEATAKKVDRLIGAARAYAAALDSEDPSDDADANRGMLRTSGGVERATCGS